MKKKKKEVIVPVLDKVEEMAKMEIFFQSSCKAALESYAEIGKIPVALTGLVQNGNNYDLLPLGEDIPDMDARIVHTITEEMMTPAAQYVNDHKGSELIALFLTIRGQGLAHTSNNKFEELNVIMSGIKTHNNLGKTLVFNIEDKDGKLTFERITTSDGDSWESKPDEKDLPAFATQELLDMFWKSYVIMRNMVTLKI